MAVAAFRSTTRRTCNVGASDEPATPRSRPTTPSRQRGHRRTRSFTELSSRYFSDSSAPTVRRSFGSGSLTASSRHLSSDSESEVESARHERAAHGSVGCSAAQAPSFQQHRIEIVSYGQPIGSKLRRSTSQHELSDSSKDAYYRRGKCDGVEDFSRKEEEVEEKTIQSVHVPMKQQGKITQPPIVELDAISIYDAMRAEVRQVVADICYELEQSSCNPAAPCFSGEVLKNTAGVGPGNGFEELADIRKEYAAKLEQSERRAQELWSQLAVEERRCHDLVKFVKGLLPVQQASLRAHERSPVKITDASTDMVLMRESLDEEAQRYFEECVSIARFDSPGANKPILIPESANSLPEEPCTWPLETNSKSALCDEGVQTILLDAQKKSNLLHFSSEAPDAGIISGKLSDCVPLGDEGLLLPWLQWEPEVDSLEHKKTVEKMPLILSSIAPLHIITEMKTALTHVNSRGTSLTGLMTASTFKSMDWDRSSLKHSHEGAIDVDEFCSRGFRYATRSHMEEFFRVGGSGD